LTLGPVPDGSIIACPRPRSRGSDSGVSSSTALVLGTVFYQALRGPAAVSWLPLEGAVAVKSSSRPVRVSFHTG
jgi:hypothetical protein